jgi:hypothetical protein
MKGVGQQFSQGTHHRPTTAQKSHLGGSLRQGKFRQHLSAGSAGGKFPPFTDHRQPGDAHPRSFNRHSMTDGDPFGTKGQAVAGVLDIDAGEATSGNGFQHTANLAAGVGRMGAAGRDSGEFKQIHAAILHKKGGYGSKSAAALLKHRGAGAYKALNFTARHCTW